MDSAGSASPRRNPGWKSENGARRGSAGAGASRACVSDWLHPEAEAELGDAAAYCATHATRLIAEAFLVENERVRDLLIKNQHGGHRIANAMQVYHFDRFPYTIIYEENEPLGPQIYAVAHPWQAPGYWALRT